MKKLLLFFVALATVTLVSAQTTTRLKPYSWSYAAKKTATGTYEVHFMVDVNNPWHTYSQFTPDGGPVPTKFSFTKNPLYTLVGKVKENGDLKKKHEDVFGVDVEYFNGKVDFVQVVKVKGNAKTNFSGSVEFMVCNDKQCLAPATENFSIALD